CLRLLLSAGGAARRRRASGGAVLRAAHPLREPDALHRRRVALPAARARPARRRAARRHRAVGQPESLSRVRPGRAPPPAAGGVTDALFLSVLQALVIALGAPLLVGTLRTREARRVGGRGAAPWQSVLGVRRLFG